jgi:hypothetical protein
MAISGRALQRSSRYATISVARRIVENRLTTHRVCPLDEREVALLTVVRVLITCWPLEPGPSVGVLYVSAQRLAGVIDTEWTKDRIEENTWINRVRFEVDRWRIGGRAGVTRTTTRLLDYWTDPARENKLFFCQIEAVEKRSTSRRLRRGPGTHGLRTTSSASSKTPNPGLFRVAPQDCYRRSARKSRNSGTTIAAAAVDRLAVIASPFATAVLLSLLLTYCSRIRESKQIS